LAATLFVAGHGTACGGETPTPRAPQAPRPDAGQKPSQATFSAAAADRMLEAAWKAAGVTPADTVDDETFARRVTLDLIGTIPTVEQVTGLRDSKAADKRLAYIDRLLASPAYAEHFMNYWDDVLMGREVRGQIVDRAAFRAWLRQKFADNTPWDAVVRELLTATGQNSAGGDRATMGAGLPPAVAQAPMMDAKGGAEDESGGEEGINGAVNWTLKFADVPPDLAGNTSRVFLGVQIQCAQCHDHKTEAWKQVDFQRFAAATLHIQTVQVDKGQVKGIRRVVLKDAPRVAGRFAKGPDLEPIGKAKPTALDGTPLDQKKETRKALATWMTDAKNPYFAKAFVNRMWGHFMGRGFVDPVDDIRPGNPAMAPELWDALTQDFVAHKFDVKHLCRTIVQTRAYQLSALSSQAKAAEGRELWASFHMVPLGPEELLNALFSATNIGEASKRANVPNLAQLRTQLARSFTFLFDVDEETDSREYEGSISQALTLLNGNLVNMGARNLPGTTLGALLAAKQTDEATLEALFLQVLSRRPTPAETSRYLAFVTSAEQRAAQAAKNDDPAASDPPKRDAAVDSKSKGKGKGERNALSRLTAKKRVANNPKQDAWEDLTWALLNSTEFVFNH
jgi:hypothetical protein